MAAFIFKFDVCSTLTHLLLRSVALRFLMQSLRLTSLQLLSVLSLCCFLAIVSDPLASSNAPLQTHLSSASCSKQSVLDLLGRPHQPLSLPKGR